MPDEFTLMTGFPPSVADRVTLANWQDPPYNRWAFRNVRNLIPTANISRGTGSVMALREDGADIEGILFEDIDGHRVTVGRMLEANFTDGFIVVHRGRIVCERYLNGLTPETPHLLMSVSKSVTGAVAAVLADRGALDVDTAVTDILPELAGTGYDGATVRHLLDMTVSTPYSEDYEDPASEVRALDVAAGWRPRDEAPDRPDNLRGHARIVAPGEQAHGEVFRYISVNTDVLGWIIERLADEPFWDILARNVWQPMGAEHDAYITVDRYGAPMTDGGICTTLRDLARFGELHLQGGTVAGRQVLPVGWIRDIRENGNRNAWARGDFADLLPGCAWYRSQWYMLDPKHGAYGGIGIHGQSVYVDPTAEMVIGKFSTHPRPVDDKLFDDMFRAFRAIGRKLAGG